MSAVGTSRTSGMPSTFLIFWGATSAARKSATAAAMNTMSASAARSATARAISSAVSTGVTATLTMSGAVSGRVVTQWTFAPREAASTARAWPCLPVDRFPMYRTGPIGSRVPPAVISMVRPAMSPAGTGPSAARIPRTASTTSASSASRPAPVLPPARWPSTGPTIVTPRSANVATLSVTAGCSHISVCMAGQTTTGARVAKRVAVSRSPDRPLR